MILILEDNTGDTFWRRVSPPVKGVVHRDLKPANIFLTSRDGETDICLKCKSNLKEGIDSTLLPRIGDFGLVVDISHCSESNSPGAIATRDSRLSYSMSARNYTFRC